MTDNQFRKELNDSFGEPPKAPDGELTRILSRLETRSRVTLVPAFACAFSVGFALLAVVLVSPPPGAASPALFSSGVTADESLSRYQDLADYVTSLHTP